MIRRRLLASLATAAMLLGAEFALAQYAVGTADVTFTDPDRDDRPVPVDLYYPATASGPNQPPATPPPSGFPAIAFGHGFLMPANVYAWLGERLAADGFVVAMPRTGGEIFPSHATFALDLAFVCRHLRALGDDASSPFHGRMSDLAAAETNPSAIAVCPLISAPALLFAGQNDCVTPPPDHQIPMYDALASTWRTLITLDGASHCQFAAYNLACDLGEACTPDITREAQQDLTWLLLRPWLRAVLRDDAAARQEFQALLETTPGVTYAQGGGATGTAAAFGPAALRLAAAPNPFNPATVITMSLDGDGPVRLEIVDARGRRVRSLLDGPSAAGMRTVTWNGRDDEGRAVSAGVYVVRVTSSGRTASTRLVLVR